MKAMDDVVMVIGPPWKAGGRIADEVIEDPRYAGRWGSRPVQDADPCPCDQSPPSQWT